VDKVALGQVFSEYFGFPCQSSFHQLLHNHPHLSSGAGTIGQKWPQYKGLSPTPLAIEKGVYGAKKGCFPMTWFLPLSLQFCINKFRVSLLNYASYEPKLLITTSIFWSFFSWGGLQKALFRTSGRKCSEITPRGMSQPRPLPTQLYIVSPLLNTWLMQFVLSRLE
jgi:hypothetical protein